MSKIRIGTRGEQPCTLDIDTLIGSRMLVQANSGGGKSWMLRLLAETLCEKVPVIILDIEGEFATLREKHDVLLTGHGREVPSAIPVAGALALKLLEHRVSAVIDLYDLKPQDRKTYVRRFLESIMAAPKNLWRPTVIFVDEAHTLAPENGESEATDAVNALMSQGRKRDFCGILATQRLSKLHKDSAAECNNVLIGRTTLDVDQKRAADVLGFDKTQRTRLRDIAPGCFWSFGPAFNHHGVESIRAGDVETTHGRKARTASIPAPSKAMHGTIGELANLAEKSKAEVLDIDEARKRIRELERELAKAAKAPTPQPKGPDPKAIEAAVHKARREAAGAFAPFVKQIGKSIERVRSELETHAHALESMHTLMTAVPAIDRIEGTPTVAKILMRSSPITPRTTVAPSDNGETPKGERAILIACAQHPEGCDREHLTIATGYKRSTRDAYIARLIPKGYITPDAPFRITDEGLAAIGDFEPLPTGSALYEHWLAKLPEGESKVLAVLGQNHPVPVDREAISEQTGYKRSTRDAYISRLATRKLVVSTRDGIALSPKLTDEGAS